jgi:hypothetical protein
MRMRSLTTYLAYLRKTSAMQLYISPPHYSVARIVPYPLTFTAVCLTIVIESRREMGNKMNRYTIRNRNTGEEKTMYAFLVKWAIKATGWASNDCMVVEWEPVA